jgi:hypothetical protein
MKSTTKMALAALLSLSSAGLASAATYHVTGSTAYRGSDVSAEVAVCGGATAKATYYGSSLTGANYSVVETSDNGATLKFENYFNGSIAGDEALVDGKTTLPFPAATAAGEVPTTITAVGTATTGATGGTAKSAPSNNATFAPYTDIETVAPDLAFSDVAFDTAQQIIKASSDKTNAVPVKTNIVGIVPFVFVANGSSDVTASLAGLSMDPQKFTFGWNSAASETLSFFTGVNADEATTVYPLGRDVDSGTRGTALAETGYGLAGSGIVTTPVAQYYPYNSQANASSGSPALTGVIGVDTTLTNPTVAALNLVPAESIDGYTMPLGDGGYYSGGNLATGISTAFATGVTNTVEMTYLGVSDAKSALTATGTNRQAATLMAYNGVTFSPTTNPSPNVSSIYEGKYTFWGYEHLFSNSNQSSNSTEAAALASAMASGTLDEESSAGVTLNSMQVGRTDDGQNVTSGNPY